VHVAIVAASAPSHMHPHLAVVRELVRRGHRVSYVVGHHLAHLAAETGADVVGCTSVLPGAPGVTGWPEDLGAVPDWVRVEDFVPQVAVLHRADAFVTHAGMGSCTEALWCGVPTVAVPQAVDQFGNAEQLAAIGVGVHLASDPPSPDDLRTALLGVAGDPDVRYRLDAISAELRRDGGPNHAADTVEDVATGTW